MRSPLRLPMAFDPEPLRADLDALRDEDWQPHFNASIYRGEWAGVALRTPGGGPGTLYPYPAMRNLWADTEILGRCPGIAAALARFSSPLTSVRLLRLGPGAEVDEHRDHKLGYADGEIRVHVPLTTNPDVEFLVEGAPLHMAPGEAWYVDFSRPHAVANRGTTPRVHLLVDTVVDDWVTQQLAAAS